MSQSRLFLPPVNRAMRVLDRSFFKKTVPLTAAHIFDDRNIARVQKECRHDILRLRLAPRLQRDPDKGKLLLLKPEVKHDDLSTASPITQELVHSKIMELIPYSLQLNYENWDYHDIMTSILPEELLSDVPSGFTKVGHIAHLNLRSDYRDYRFLIGEVLLDKNHSIRTVVNKLDDVGTTSEYRTFPMEVLAGSKETEVEEHHSGCTFRFDFAKVYWNSRLDREHTRLITMFKPGEAVADVMAGVGPFALPAAKRDVLVFANDLNPDCYEGMVRNAKLNKVNKLVSSHNEDGATFIRDSIRSLYQMSRSPASRTIQLQIPPSAYKAQVRAERVYNQLKKTADPNTVLPPKPEPVKLKYFSVPPTFSHFVMNLPATAVEFLGAFMGSHRGLEHLFEGPEARQLPMIHVYIFDCPKDNPNASIRARIKKYLGHEPAEEDVEIVEVRDVAPNKSYYCASFRLPAEVAFSENEPPIDEDAAQRAKRQEAEELWLKWTREN